MLNNAKDLINCILHNIHPSSISIICDYFGGFLLNSKEYNIVYNIYYELINNLKINETILHTHQISRTLDKFISNAFESLDSINYDNLKKNNIILQTSFFEKKDKLHLNNNDVNIINNYNNHIYISDEYDDFFKNNNIFEILLEDIKKQNSSTFKYNPSTSKYKPPASYSTKYKPLVCNSPKYKSYNPLKNNNK
jgi:hypothetical protein